MKKTKVIIPALGILLLSTAASVTGTVAWFSSNASVDATGMTVKAAATYGIVISNKAAKADENDTEPVWSNSAASLNSAVTTLSPGSTGDLSHWVYSTSTISNEANTQQDYSVASAWSTTNTTGNYVVHDFYIKASADEELAVSSLDVEEIVLNDSTAPTQPLSASLRVGVLATGGTPLIFAPVAGFTTDYSARTGAGTYAATAASAIPVHPYGQAAYYGVDARVNDTAIHAIPANSATPLNVKVFIWFEGEDENCISANIVTNLEQIGVTVRFAYTEA